MQWRRSYPVCSLSVCDSIIKVSNHLCVQLACNQSSHLVSAYMLILKSCSVAFHRFTLDDEHDVMSELGLGYDKIHNLSELKAVHNPNLI